MLVSPRDFDSWRQLCDTKTCNYPCILPGSLRLKEKRRIRENSENIKKVLCFTALDAIPQSQKAHHLKRRNAETIVFYRSKCDFQRSENVREKMRIAFSIAFYDTKCDRRKSESQNRGPKRKCVKTLAPVDESNVSHLEGTQRSSENKQNS